MLKAKANVAEWSKYEETKEDLEVYTKTREGSKVVLNMPNLKDSDSTGKRELEKVEESSSGDSESHSSSSDPSFHPPEGRPSDTNKTASDKYLHKRNKHKKRQSTQSNRGDKDPFK